ncbi:hypothetical protein [Paenibacillus glycanilyticus]|uniref:hypothetical protein n=1 Tax=Paenibacillus glycanilyticus TaxID=126569 RepID=UPI001910A5C3|nr:hypothetical protein [Paenibacillus glycanilyticus]
MKRKTQKAFYKDALECTELLSLGMEYFGFNERARKTMDKFYDYEYQQGEIEEKIKKKLGSAYMAFLGKTNWRYRSDINNKVLFDKLSGELAEIKEELRLNGRR